MIRDIINNRATEIMADWANGLPPERRGGKSWEPGDFTHELPLKIFDMSGFRDLDLLQRLQDGLGLPHLPKWGKYTFGDVLDELKKIPAEEIGAFVSTRTISRALDGVTPKRPARLAIIAGKQAPRAA